ncbi:MAG: RNA methyltransferase, partial [Gordonibacter sp.]
MPLIRVESSEDLRLAPYSGMTDAQLRDSPDSEQGLFIGESRKVIERALAANVRLRSLFLEEKWLDQTTGLIERLLASD